MVYSETLVLFTMPTIRDYGLQPGYKGVFSYPVEGLAIQIPILMAFGQAAFLAMKRPWQALARARGLAFG